MIRATIRHHVHGPSIWKTPTICASGPLPCAHLVLAHYHGFFSGRHSSWLQTLVGGPKDGSSTLHEGERASKWHASLLCLTVWSRREGAKYTTKPSSLYRRINASWGIGHGWLRLGIGTDGGAPKSIAPESAPSMPHESIVGESAMTAPGDRERWWCIKRRQ
jgi:hypothetical protein